jgi:hypothetical protein
MSTFLGFLTVVGFVLGSISVVYPLKFVRIHDRRTGIKVAAISFAASVCVGAFSGHPSESISTKPISVAAKPMPIDDGCNIAGAIPNCHEEVKRMVAAEASLPPRPPEPSSAGKVSRLLEQFRSDVEKEENRIKAAEAAANQKALALEREAEESRVDMEYRQRQLEAIRREGEEKMRQSQAAVDSANYDVRIAQRKLEAARRGY